MQTCESKIAARVQQGQAASHRAIDSHGILGSIICHAWLVVPVALTMTVSLPYILQSRRARSKAVILRPLCSCRNLGSPAAREHRNAVAHAPLCVHLLVHEPRVRAGGARCACMAVHRQAFSACSTQLRCACSLHLGWPSRVTHALVSVVAACRPRCHKLNISGCRKQSCSRSCPQPVQRNARGAATMHRTEHRLFPPFVPKIAECVSTTHQPGSGL